jgi:hypothetical protein
MVNQHELTIDPESTPMGVEEAKELIETVAGRLGGSRRLHEWVQEHPDNERAFWCLIDTKLIPYSHSISGNLTVNWPLPKSKLDE